MQIAASSSNTEATSWSSFWSGSTFDMQWSGLEPLWQWMLVIILSHVWIITGFWVYDKARKGHGYVPAETVPVHMRPKWHLVLDINAVGHIKQHWIMSNLFLFPTRDEHKHKKIPTHDEQEHQLFFYVDQILINNLLIGGI